MHGWPAVRLPFPKWHVTWHDLEHGTLLAAQHRRHAEQLLKFCLTADRNSILKLWHQATAGCL